MAANPAQSSPDRRIGLAILLLAIAGGSADAIVMLGFHVLTAAQTGNTILLAVALVQGQFATGFHAAVSLAGYIIGVAGAEWVMNKGRIPLFQLTPVGCSVLAELISLAILFICWQLAGRNLSVTMAAGIVILAAISMGIQSATVLHLHAGPKTTYVTGTLTTFLTGFVRRLIQTDAIAPPSTTTTHNNVGGPLQAEVHAWRYGFTWLVYVGGALAGGWLFLHQGPVAVALPIGSVVIVLFTGIL